mgnify:CR=1 FL=1
MTNIKLLSAGLMAATLGVATGCTSTPLILDGPIYHPNGGVYYPDGKGDYKKHDDYKKKNNVIKIKDKEQ